MILAVGSIAAGLVLLIKGANLLVNGGATLARRSGVSDLVIGLTIVSFGTSAPELLVNIVASVRGNADIAIGNIVGSNIANILLILGISALVAPLTVQRSTVIKEIPFAMLAAVTLFIMANDRIVDKYPVSELSRSDGTAFIAFFIIFLYYTFGMRKRDENHEEFTEERRPIWLPLSLVIGGMISLAIGGKLTVDGAVEIALRLGVSQALIGLTIVAVGTSLPELAASAVAAYKGNADIAVGNIVGSNIFNIFWILGLSAIIKPLLFQPGTNMDLLVVILATLMLFFIVHNGHIHRRLLLFWKQVKDYTIERWEGGLLLSTYIVYLVYIGWRG